MKKRKNIPCFDEQGNCQKEKMIEAYEKIK